MARRYRNYRYRGKRGGSKLRKIRRAIRIASMPLKLMRHLCKAVVAASRPGPPVR